MGTHGPSAGLMVWISAMSEILTHAKWAQRVEALNVELQGRWGWTMGLTDYRHRAILVDPEGIAQGALVLEHAPGIVAALNTVEGRRAYSRAVQHD